MYAHHQVSIENLINYFKDDKDVISIILGGSVAKGLEREDSDIDSIIVVTEERYKVLEKENRLSECIMGHCPYQGGYFDIKYCTKNYLISAAENGSEPTRSSFASSKCLYTTDPEIDCLIKEIPMFQHSQKEEKLLSFYSALHLNQGYFWGCSKNNIYLKHRSAVDIVLFGLRLFLQEQEVLFPSHKALLKETSNLGPKGKTLVNMAEDFLLTLTDEKKTIFVETLKEYVTYEPPEDDTKMLSQYIIDDELWWYRDRPRLSAW